MYKRLKVRLYPTVKQKIMLDNHFNAYRFCYNLCLSYKSLLWADYKKSVSGFDMQKELFEIRKNTDWLSKCKAECIRDAALQVDKAFNNFFKGNGYPKYKSKKVIQSFNAYQSLNCNNYVLTFYRSKIRFRTSNKYNNLLKTNNIKQVTFKKDLTGSYFATFLIDTAQDKHYSNTDNEIGIDLGIKYLLIASNGESFENKKMFKSNYYKLCRLQRRFAKTKKGGANRDKLRLKIAKLFQKITRQKEHYYHQITNKLIQENQLIVLESLSITNMIKNRRMSKVITDASWGILTSMLEYKAKWYGREVIKIDNFYPSSKTCSNCGNKKEELKLSERVYNCGVCGFNLDRDINAAINILKEGQRISGLKIPEVSAENITLVSSMKQKVKV